MSIQKTLTFNGKKFEAKSVSSVSELIKAIALAPNRLTQAVNFAVSASLSHTENNQLGPIRDLVHALAFSDSAALKKQGSKLVSFIKLEVKTLEVTVAKKQEKVVIKYLTEEGKRELPEALPSFSSWEAPKEERIAAAVTEKAVKALSNKWIKREKALQEAGKADELATEKLSLKVALMHALDALAPELELFKAEEGDSENKLFDELESTKLTTVEEEVEKLKAAEKVA